MSNKVDVAPVTPTEQRTKSQQYDSIYRGMRSKGSTDPPWMNCGYVPPEWTDEQVTSVIDDLIAKGKGDKCKDYGLRCKALAREMYMSTLDMEAGIGLPSPSVLDCGCGYGAQTILFKELNPDTQYNGINISEEQIECAREYTKHCTDVSLNVADATDLSQFADGQFSNVYALECAFHFNTRLKFLKEASRVLRPGGSFAATDVINVMTTREKLREVRLDAGFFWLWYLVTNFAICKIMYGTGSYPENKENSIAEYEKSLNEAGFTGEIKIKDISGEVFFYNNVVRHRILGMDKGWFRRWTSPSGWYNCLKFLFTEWSANPFMLAMMCRKELAPYVLVTAYK